jgi:fibronectin type 3 domain-containing protein
MTDASNTVEGSVEKVAPAVTLKAGTKSVKVSWKKVEGVTHYQVYRATSEDGKYTKLTTTKETSYTAKSLTSGKTYFFKVRGYKIYKSGYTIKYNVYTTYSNIKSLKTK